VAELTIEKAENDGVPIVRFKGSLDTKTNPQAEAAMKELLESKDPPKTLVLNLGGLTYISSVGLRTVIAASKAQKGRKGELRLCGLKGTVKDVFEMSGLIAFLKVFPEEEDALG
jgi:anti-anti-sigma factor